ncbi:amino acid adenylation domain-containing protein [Amycolatopsis sp. NPDC059027]|uniref:non-ribosomal peptide synthetase n=1 Tax=Amycolatopsis sp. NPDC059027 TaxID=3346709 RepID=UPI003670FA9D
MIGDLIAELTAAGVTLWTEDGRLRFRAPRGYLTAQRLDRLREHKQAILEHLRQTEASSSITPDPGARHEPFPLTDVQSAYLLGRSDAFDYGAVACHGYLEFAFAELDPVRLEPVWRDMIARHDMLRAVVSPEGYQRVLAEVPAYRIEVEDQRGEPPAGVQRAIEATRQRWSHRVRRTDEWPLIDLLVTRTDRQDILHVSVDLLVCDYFSVQLLFAELARRYAGEDVGQDPEPTFRDYVLAERGLRDSAGYRADRDYWWQRIDRLPPGPELPVLERSATDSPPRFARWETRLSKAEWGELGRQAAAHGITVSTAVLAAYAEVIGRWSRRSAYTLNLTLLNRLPLHPDVDRLIGDFSSVTLLPVDTAGGAPLGERARAMQAQLWSDMDHRSCSGVEVLRELGRRRGRDAALLPVAFTSTLGVGAESGDGTGPAGLMPGAELVYGISQTPQVWIDCQVMEGKEELLVNWDVREGVFPDGLVEPAFAAFTTLLHELAAGDDAWTSNDPVRLPAAQLAVRQAVNGTAGPLPDGLLHHEVVATALRTPDRTAVRSTRRALTYRELLDRAGAVADELSSAGCERGELVAVVMDKGWEQVVGVFGVLLAGAAYLPIDTNQPPARRDAILLDAGVRRVLTQPWLAGSLGLPDGVRHLTVEAEDPPEHRVRAVPEQAGPDDLAYVIYTSGSTGRPKGVMITHRAARNTIDDINRRFGVGDGDRVLGLANLGFDLSVYDLFGPLAVGGSLVLPSAGRRGDPSHWAETIDEHGVTLWNSVPAQLHMLGQYLDSGHPAEGGGGVLPTLRLALLSGDWIPVGLPDAMRRRLPGLSLVSLGGATEASIWSIHYPIGQVDPAWRSIPYGTPLTNQSFHVLDEAMRPCPDLVPGNLYIGGAGVASGYLGDEEKTGERFVTHPVTGERLYSTGDVGRYLPDGVIEFLGREDFQVKVRGHRIELAEISSVLAEHPAIASAEVLVDGSDALDRQLVAFAETARNPETTHAVPDLRAVAEAAGAELSTRVDGEALTEISGLVERVALASMADALWQAGLFSDPGVVHGLPEILTATGAAERNHRLIRRWLKALSKEGMLERVPAGYRDLRAPSRAAIEAMWRRIDELEPVVDWGVELLRYLRVAEQNLPELIRDELDPLSLLFPEGRLEVAEAAYRENLISGYLNRVVVHTVRRIAEGRRGGAPLRVLEIGAGVGGTSNDLIPALTEFDADYLFTDLSQFFLNEARQRFAEQPWVRYGLFDLNEPYRNQGVAPNSVDVVLCANVLHNSKHAGKVLARFHELLAPGGWLVFIEATRDTYHAMASMEFKEGLTDFVDFRAEQDTTFIGREQWLELLTEAGAEPAFCLPAPDDPLSRIGQHVFAAQVKTGRMPVTAAELTGHLDERLPDYMVPAEIQVVDSIPLSDNGKVDRRALADWLPKHVARQRPAGGTAPVGARERALAEVWSEVLQVPQVGRDENFFALGGDSLLVAQLIGRVRERLPEAAGRKWDNLLRQMLNQPTIAATAAYLSRGSGQDATTTGSLIRINDVAGGTAMVFVHDGAGTIAPYRALLDALGDHGPSLGLALADIEPFLAADPGDLIKRLAGDYATELLAAGHDKVRVVGYCMGGLLATELASELTEQGATVENLTVISSYRVPFLVEDDLLAEYIFARVMRADPVALGYPADEVAMRQTIAAVLAKTPGRVPAGSLAEVPETGEVAEAVRAFRRLAGREQSERLAAIGATMRYAGSELGSAERVRDQYRVLKHSLTAVARHDATPYRGPVTFIRQLGETQVLPGMRKDMSTYWEQLCLGELRVVDVPGDHFSCLHPPNVSSVFTALTTDRGTGRTVGAP